MSDLLQEARTAKQIGDITLAKQLISQALVQNPSYEAAWMLMSEVVDDVRLKRNCLERVLAINPHNSEASTALTKLNTSPLSPVTRGERDKPTSPPTLENIPPFTPPFTWEGKDEQYLALGDMTYPELSEEKPVEPAEELTPTFDWANDSPEPDKTIQKIFDAVSNPEQASEPLQDSDLNWMEDKEAEEQPLSSLYTQAENASTYSEELVGPPDETYEQPRSTNPEDFSVTAEPQLGLSAFTTDDLPLEAVTSDYRLWDNPKARQERMVIVNNEALICATPKESDVPHILGLFNEHKMMAELLGQNPKTIKLNTIQRLTAVPRKRDLNVEYKNEKGKLYKQHLTFADPAMRDDALEALKLRLGAGYPQKLQTFSLGDKIVPPLVTMLFVAFIGWGLIVGLPMVRSLDPTQIGAVLGLLDALQSFIDMVGTTNILMVAAIIILLCLIWMINNLRQPTKLLVVHR